MHITVNRVVTALVAAAAFLLAAPAPAKDGVIEIKGAVQSMPAGGGFVGAWTIAGRSVQSSAATVIEQDDGPLVVGARVEVKGTPGAGDVVLATKIEVDSDGGTVSPPAPPKPPTGGDDDDDEFEGRIDALPGGGTFVGTWTVAGRKVIVLTTTRLDQEDGGFVVGAIVEVKGTPGPDGFVARKIETESSSEPGRGEDDDRFEIHGVVEALPAGAPADLTGTWKVAGRDVLVSASTELEAEHGPFVVGGAVEVKGVPLDGGAIQASKIESKAGNGAGVPALMFTGAIEALPPAGTIGVWTIGGKSVNVTAATKLKTEDGPFVVGAIVEVEGWLQADGAIEAHEIETEDASSPSGGSKIAVEYVHKQTGHYFMTALKVEIDALDAGAFGGVWVRTGETIKVGGNVGVCRFYGMPPKGPSSHFFTADPVECKKVMVDFDAWTFEQHAFAIFAAPNGSCPPGLVAVRRFYNNPAAGADVNHRYVVTSAIAAQMNAAGWIDEGIVMCAQK